MTPLDDPTRLPSRDLMCIDCKSFYASVEAISRAVRYLFEQHWAGEPLRHVAVRVSKVSNPETAQLSIFETADKTEARDALELTMDKIRAKLGYTAIFRASSKLDGGTAIARSGLVGGHAK